MSLSLPPLQHTIARTVDCAGIGLHGGATVNVRLRPARSRGLVLRRVDLERRLAAEGRHERVEIPVRLEGVSHVDHATTLSCQTPAGPASVGTVEHLVAALAAMRIDACVIEVDGPEIPILDGSSLPWLSVLRRAGRRALPRARRQMRVLRPVTVSKGAASVSAYPADQLRVTCSIDFPHPSIGRQEISLAVTARTFASELAGARTFGFLAEVEALRAAGLALGGSMENAIVLDDAGVTNGPLRFADEFVRHKALDLVGDLALLGHPVVGHFVARRAGHALHVELARALMADRSAWTLESVAPEAILHAAHASSELAARVAE